MKSNHPLLRSIPCPVQYRSTEGVNLHTLLDAEGRVVCLAPDSEKIESLARLVNLGATSIVDNQNQNGIWFRPARHWVRDVTIIEVWYRDRFIATICPPPDSANDIAAITVISKHLQNTKDTLFIEAGFHPALFVRFDPLAE